MDVMGFVADNMGHFTLYDIPNVFFMVFMAALLGYVLARSGGRSTEGASRALALWAATAALASAFVRGQLPLAIILVAFVLLARGDRPAPGDRTLQFGALILGLGCGSGAALITMIVSLPYLLLVRWSLSDTKS